MSKSDFGDDWDDDILNDIAQAEASLPKNQSDSPKQEYLNVLKTHFGHQTFRPMQWKIINSILNHKKDNCAIMSTGYGKSLCFQYPSVFTGGVTFVISPLISLMEDQVLSLTVANIPACLLGTANKEQAKTIKDISSNKFRLVYLTPEFCGGDYGRELLESWGAKLPVTLIAIDEAHCVSSWGHDFRTSYRHLGKLRDVLPNVPILAVTATATEQVKTDIIKSLHLRNPELSFTSFDRPNFYFCVYRKSDCILSDFKKIMTSENDRWKFDGSTIVYCITRKHTENISEYLSSLGVKCAPYHAGLTMRERKETHEKYVRDKLDVVVATIAFGMGIDKPDVRNVIHYGVSNSIESYYQEVGRAGRDGQPAKCVCFHDDNDLKSHRFLIAQSKYSSNKEQKEKMLMDISNYVHSNDCRRKYILSYFGENYDKPISDNCCDNCSNNEKTKSNHEKYLDLDEKGNFNFSKDARLFLAAVAGISYRFGVGAYVDFLRGSKREKLKKFVDHPLHGAGKDKPEMWWKELGHLLVRKKFLSNNSCSLNSFAFILDITDAGKAFLEDSNKELIAVPNEVMLRCLKMKSNIWHNKDDPISAALPGPSTQEIFDEHMEVYSLLLDARAKIAASEDCMPYMIASNKALMEMAKLRPQSLKEMDEMQFDGLTTAKIQKFGRRLLDAMPKISVKTIKEHLNMCPLPGCSTSPNSSSCSSYSIYETGKSLKEIAKERNMAVSTIENHLTACMKSGYEVKLSAFEIDKIIAKTITAGIIAVNSELTFVTAIKGACPEEITFGQIRALTTFLRIREHLDEYNLKYVEFDDPEYYQMFKQMRDNHEQSKNLDRLLEGLQSVEKDDENSNISDVILSNICDNLEDNIQGNSDEGEPNKKKLRVDFSDLLDSPPREDSHSSYKKDDISSGPKSLNVTSLGEKVEKVVTSSIQPTFTSDVKKDSLKLPVWLKKKRVA